MKKSLLILSCFLLIGVQQVVAQEEASPFTYGIGNINITLLPEGGRESRPDALVGATEEMLAKCLPEGTYESAVNAFLIETHDKAILVDAGFGNKLFDHLNTCGKSPEEIDLILMTHLHGDHIGGLLREGEKSFPNATLYVSQPEYDHWMNDQEMQRLPEDRRGNFVQARKVMEVYKENLQLFVPGDIIGNIHEIIPGIRSIAAYGHTPGHTGYLLEAYGEQLFIWGDVAHVMPVQIAYPQVTVTYDSDPVQAAESRQRLLSYIVENKIEVAGMHIEYPGMAKLRKYANGNYEYILTCTCEGLLR